MADRWHLAPSLVALRDEANRRWPNRDRTSDGSVGDVSHQARSSDHNPDWNAPGARRGIVRAYDLDEDLDGDRTDRGPELAAWVNHLVATRDPRVAYIIYEGRIVSSSIAPWTWRPYSGVNAHRKHVHVSIRHTVAAEQNVSPWFPPVPAPPSPPAPKRGKMLFLIKTKSDARWWLTDWLTKRHIASRDEAKVVLFLTAVGGAPVSTAEGGGPHILSDDQQEYVDRIPLA